MKRILTVLLLFGLLMFAPNVYAADDFDTARAFGNIDLSGHCYTDVDGVGICDYVVLETSFEAVTDSNTYINFTIPYLGYSDLMSNYTPDVRSTLTFYDSDMDVLTTEALWDNATTHFSGANMYWVYDLEDVFGVGSVPGDLNYFSLKVIFQFGEPNQQSRIPIGFRDYMETYMVYEVDDEIGVSENEIMRYPASVNAFFFSELDVFAIVPMEAFGILDLVYAPYWEPPTPVRPGYIFMGWRTSDGEPYTFDMTSEVEDGDATKVFLYASWRSLDPIGTDIEGYTPPDGITNVLNLIGFNSEAGKIIIYVAVTLILMALFVAINLPLFAVSAMVLIMTAFFILIGWLVPYAAILFGGTALILMFISFKAVGTSE